MNAAALLISVVVPAHNEERTLGRTLAGLEAQTLAHERFEVILADDRSEDRTVEIAQAFADKLNLRIVSCTSGSIAAVRNCGAALAQAGILLFLDADCVPRPGMLTAALALAAMQTLWGAHYLVPPDSTWVGKVWARFQATEQQGPVSFLPGGTLLMHRGDFRSLGGFQQALETSEDVELCQRARQQHGMQVVAYPELAAFHYGTPRDLPSFFRQNRWHGKHVLRAFLDAPSPRTFRIVGLSAYTLVAFWCGALGLLLCVFSVRWLLALVPLLLLPVSLALLRTVKARRLQDLPALAVLYLVYLLARAFALWQSPARGKRT